MCLIQLRSECREKLGGRWQLFKGINQPSGLLRNRVELVFLFPSRFPTFPRQMLAKIFLRPGTNDLRQQRHPLRRGAERQRINNLCQGLV